MDAHIVVPLALFACVTYAFRAVLDAALRYRLLRMGSSPDLVRAILDGEERQRRIVALRWGIVLTALAIAFALIKALGWNEVSPGVIAVLAATTGLGNLAFFTVSKRLMGPS